MTAAWSVILMLMGWLPGNGAQQPGINAPDSLNLTPPAQLSADSTLVLERSA